MKIYGVILSAGKSTRMGMPKALAKIEDKTFLEIICENMIKCGIKNIFIIAGKHEQQIKKCTNIKPLNLIINPDYDAEQFSSIKLAIHNLSDKSDAIMIALVDHPLIKLETYKILFDAAHKIENKILIPSYNHRAGHPIIIPQNTYRLFLQSNEETARDVIRNHRELVEYINVNDKNILKNINIKKDLPHKKLR